MRLVWMHLPLLCIENNAKGEKMALNDVSISVSESDYKGGQVLGAFAEWSCQMSVSHQASWSRLLFADDDDGGLGGGFEQAKLINLPLALLLLLLNPPPLLVISAAGWPKGSMQQPQQPQQPGAESGCNLCRPSKAFPPLSDMPSWALELSFICPGSTCLKLPSLPVNIQAISLILLAVSF